MNINNVIKFGTDGWRAVIAEDFTFENVTKVSSAVAAYFNREKKVKNPKLVIGYDTRFNSEKFAETAEKIYLTGINIIGGCCGTTPKHIEAVAGRLKNTI